jgi:hypothetical protein
VIYVWVASYDHEADGPFLVTAHASFAGAVAILDRQIDEEYPSPTTRRELKIAAAARRGLAELPEEGGVVDFNETSWFTIKRLEVLA